MKKRVKKVLKNKYKVSQKIKKENQKYNHYAILGFVLSFLSWFSIVGILLCIFALLDIRNTKQKGKWLALSGIIIGILVLYGTINGILPRF